MTAPSEEMDTSPTNISLTEYPSDFQILFIAGSSINLILGLPINVYVLWLIVTGVRGTIASEFFTLNLTVSEILFTSLAIFNLIWIKYHTITVMNLVNFAMGLIYTARPLFQCCICIERYLAVVHPVIYLKYKPLRYRVGCCGVVWLMVLGSCLCFMLTDFTYKYNVYFAEFLVLFLVYLFCCLSVLRALKRPGPGEGEERRGTNDMKMRAFKIILIVMVSMLVYYLSYFVVIAFQCYLNSGEFKLALTFCFLFIVIIGFVHPFHYIHRAGKQSCIRGL